MLKACIIQNSEDCLNEYDVHCRQRFEKHDDVELVKSLDVFVVVVILNVAVIVVVVVVLFFSLVSIISI